jgi:RNA polymerase sigma factor (sigma-70 family)
MQAMDDMALLQEYAAGNSEAAFETLVSRRVGFVYSAALRQVRDPHLAEEIAQAVFVILAQKAGRIFEKTILTGWFFRTTRFAALAQIRDRAKRRQRELEVQMQSEFLSPAADEIWNQMSPLLDEALATLGEKDRQAVLLRFFENKSLAEVGKNLGTGEDTARKRVSRALEKLHRYFAKHGVSSTTAIIAGAISANSVQTAPLALAKSVTAVAIAKGAAANGLTLTLINETLKIMTHAKLKLAIGITGGILLATGAITMVISQTTNDDKRTPQEIAKQSQDAYAALSSYSDSGTVEVEGVGGNPYKMTFNIRLARPNLYRVDWARAEAKAGLSPMTGTAWSDGIGDHVEAGLSGKLKKDDMQSALALGTFVSGNSAINIPGTFFKQPWGDVLSLTTAGQVETKIEKDERIGDVDCYVISRVADAAKLRAEGMLPNLGNMGMATSTDIIWIGKRDHLIHQIRSSLDLSSITTRPQLSDAEAKRMLELAKIPITPEAIARIKKGYENTAKSATRSMIKSGKIVFTETHENISVNQKFSTADFGQ